MDIKKITQIAQAYKDEMLSIDANFPVTKQAMALSVWTQLSPIERYEIMSSIEKMPKSMAAKQAKCLKVIEGML